MKREDIRYTISILLIGAISVTGILGYVQSQLELRKFMPHRYFAYTTLILAAIHVSLNIRKIWRFLRTRFITTKGSRGTLDDGSL